MQLQRAQKSNTHARLQRQSTQAYTVEFLQATKILYSTARRPTQQMKAGVAGSATVKSKSFATITLIACQHQRVARSNLALRFKNGHAIVLQAEHHGALAVCVAA